MTVDNDNPLGGFLKRGTPPPLPPADQMIAFGLEAMQNSGIGMELVMFVQEHNVKIKIITSKEERYFVGDNDEVIISLKAIDPARPARFILLLAAGIRDLMQNHEGLKNPPYTMKEDEAMEIIRRKEMEKVGYMCAVAYEINEIETFKSYHMIKELKDMGYEEQYQIFLEHGQSTE